MNPVEITTIDFLHKLEIPPHLRGYAYIVTAVKLLIEKPALIYAVTKDLYPAIADEHGIEWTGVERCIRNVVSENKLINLDAMKSLLSIKGGRPTNSHFLAALAEAVRIQMAKEGSAIAEAQTKSSLQDIKK